MGPLRDMLACCMVLRLDRIFGKKGKMLEIRFE